MRAIGRPPCFVGPAGRGILTRCAESSAQVFQMSGTAIAMAVGGTDLVIVIAPIVGQLDPRMALPLAIADEGQRELAAREVVSHISLIPSLLV
jgi:hypothetical protein